MAFYHGTRAALNPGEMIELIEPGFVHFTAILDEAIWDAELAEGDAPPRIYIVEPAGRFEDVHDKTTAHPTMSLRSRDPLRVIGEVTEWTLYHGTRADLKPGDFISPGNVPNFGDRTRTQSYVYFTRTLDAATWGAELAQGEQRGRIYIVEPTGPMEDDPNLTNKKFRGNPTKAFRSHDPLRIIGEVVDWKGHPPEKVQAMKDGLARLKASGTATIDG